MPRFRYKVVTPAGELVEGEMTAADRAAVIDRLHGEGCMPIRAEEVGEGAIARVAAFQILGGRRMPTPALINLTQQLATLLRAGLPLDRALTLLAGLADGAAERAFVGGVRDAVRSGTSLADALERRHQRLPGFYIGMVRAGEAGGNLDQVLARLAELLARAEAVRESVRAAMVYPVIVLVVASVSIGVLLTVVIPEFQPLFDNAGAALPASTRLIIVAGELLKQWWWALVAAAAALVAAGRYHYAQPAGRLWWNRAVLRAPLLGAIALKNEVARFSRTFGTLLASGVVALNALSIAAHTLTNRAVAASLADIGEHLRKGEGLAGPLQQSAVFPPLAVQLIQVGEETGQMHAMLLRIADIYDEEVKRALQRLLALLVPAITVALGLLVAVIIGSMLTAILSVYRLPR